MSDAIAAANRMSSLAGPGSPLPVETKVPALSSSKLRRARRQDREDRAIKLAAAAAALLAAMLSGLYFLDASEMDSTMGRLIGFLLAGLSFFAAILAPRTVPLFVAGYIPFCSHYAYSSVSNGFLNMPNFLIMMLVLAWLRSSVRRTGRLRVTIPDKALIAFLLWVLLSHTYAWFQMGDQSILEFLTVYRRWVAPFIYYFLARAVMRDYRDARALFAVVLWTSGLVALVSWHAGATMGSHTRLSGVLDQPNTMGAFLAYFAIPHLALALCPGSVTLRGIGLTGYLLFARTIMYTASRGAYLAFLVGAVVGLLGRGPLYLVGAGAGTFAAMSFFPQLVPEHAIGRMMSTTAEGRGDDEALSESDVDNLDASSRIRLYLWDAGLLMIADHPFLGLGLGRFGQFSHAYLLSMGISPEASRIRPTAAHNSYLQIAAESGLPALILVPVFFAGYALQAWKGYWRGVERWSVTLALSLTAMIPTIAVCSFFGGRMIHEALASCFWLLLASFQYSTIAPALAAPRPTPFGRAR